LTWHVKFSGAA